VHPEGKHPLKRKNSGPMGYGTWNSTLTLQSPAHSSPEIPQHQSPTSPPQSYYHYHHYHLVQSPARSIALSLVATLDSSKSSFLDFRYQGNATTTQTSGQLADQELCKSTLLREDLDVNIIAFNFWSRSYIPIQSIKEFRDHLRRQRLIVARSYVYLVDTGTLSAEVARFLGFSLNLSLGLWQAHWRQREGLDRHRCAQPSL